MGAIVGLRHFQLKGNGLPNDATVCQVYKNGRQQFQLDIMIDAYDMAGETVPLTQEQMASIKLIDYGTGYDIDGQLDRSLTKNIYDFYNGVAPTGDHSARQNMSGVRLYLSVPEASSIAQNHTAAEVTLNGNTFRTNNVGSVAGGHFNGGFNSSIIIKTVPPHLVAAESFNIKNLGMILFSYRPGDIPYFRLLFRWEITFKDPNFRILGSNIPDTPIINWFSQFVRKGDNKDTGHWALPVKQQGESVWLGALRQGSSSADVRVEPYTKDGAAYAIHEEAEWFETHQYVSKQITYFDNNGCGQSVHLLPNNNGTTLQLMDHPPY